MPENTLKTAGTLSARASKSLDAMRTHVTRADAPRSDAAHQARAANVVDAATTVRPRQEAQIPEPMSRPRCCGHAGHRQSRHPDRVLDAVKARRVAPPPRRGADGPDRVSAPAPPRPFS